MERALAHREVDRPPRDLGGLAWSIVEGEPYGYRRLCDYLKINCTDFSYRRISSTIFPLADELLRRFDIDFRHVRLDEPTRLLDKDVVVDFLGIKWRKSGYAFFPIDPPLLNVVDTGYVEDYFGAIDFINPTFFSKVGKDCKRLREENRYCVVLDLGPVRSIFHRYFHLRGFSNWVIDMYRNPELYVCVANNIFEINKGVIREVINQVDEQVDIICLAEDQGAQASPFISAGLFSRFVEPWLKGMIEYVKKNTKAKVLLHSDGSVFSLIPGFIRCGIDILNPIQTHARGMEPEELKSRFGDKISFHGGLDVQYVLPHKKTEEVADHAARLRESLNGKGGYIQAPSQDVGPDIPPGNLCAAFGCPVQSR